MSSLAKSLIIIFMRFISFKLWILFGIIGVVRHSHGLGGLGLPPTLAGPVTRVVVGIVGDSADRSICPQTLANKPLSDKGWLKPHSWSKGTL